MHATSKSADTKRDDRRRYDDIIDLPHPVSATHPPMSLQSRAAQFAPFAALTGHEAALRETARLTERRTELAEDAQALLNERLRLLGARSTAQTAVTLTYFQPDPKKPGGAYVQASGRIKKIDDYERLLILQDGTRIPVDDVVAIGDAPRFSPDGILPSR